MHNTRSYPLSPAIHAAAERTATTAPATLLNIAPGRALWLYVEAGSSLYCSAGQVHISSPWHGDMALAAEDAPYCNGAHAGWYWAETRSAEPAQLQLMCKTYAGRGGLGSLKDLWQAATQWMGLRT